MKLQKWTGSPGLIAMLFLAAVIVMAAEDAPPLLRTYRDTYETELDRIEKDSAETAAALPVNYRSSLGKLEERLQRDADLDGLLVVRKEVDRFKKEENVPEEAFVDAPAALRELQESYRAAQWRVELDKARRAGALTDKYIAALQRMQDDLTRSGQIESAVTVKAAAEAARAEPAYTAAQFVLAEHAAKAAQAPEEAATAEKAPVVSSLSGLPRHPDDSERFSSHWYKAFVEDVSWHEAKARCEEMGGYLACVTTRMESRFITGLGAGQTLWLGGTDEAREGTWTWVSGEPFVTDEWALNQPNAAGDAEDYLCTRTFDFSKALHKLAKAGIPRSFGAKEFPLQWHDARQDKPWRNMWPTDVRGFICEWER